MNKKMQSNVIVDVIIAHQTVKQCSNKVKALAERCVHDLGNEMLITLKREEEGYDYTPHYGEIIRDYAVDAYEEHDCSFEEFQKIVDAITLIGAMPYC